MRNIDYPKIHHTAVILKLQVLKLKHSTNMGLKTSR